jgi:hypothetical protein
VRFRLALLDALAKGRFLAEDRVMKIKVIASAFLALGYPDANQLAAEAEPTLQPPLSLSRLDCGSIDIANLADFSDTGRYEARKRLSWRAVTWSEAATSICVGYRPGRSACRQAQGQDGSLVREKIATQLARGKVRPETSPMSGSATIIMIIRARSPISPMPHCSLARVIGRH